ncbi:hypothetical protein QFW80_00045 [Luteimonas sp. M1R5S18]|uniref:Integron gene cassette protein n=1 Tax=Luteimonas rhizosphaericola TaxID=3042024 RepID=A0ABT6JE55_9GAMM|nr:hypothetical protein [Luteimonas rhizosphaericola]MDH5828914.1 hypothetical protein [Luteimonas rhizosphaericola]
MAGVASMLVLGGIFIATMLVHYQAIDWPYLQFALLRIGAISLAVAVLAHLLAKWLRSSWRAALFGAVAGFAGGVAFVAAAA